jgi:hypothetical protein
MAQEEKKDIFRLVFGVDQDTVIRTIWGFVLPHIGPKISDIAERSIAERIPNETIKNILASLAGAGAQILEKGGGVWREMFSDVLENITYGIRGERPGVRAPREIPPERRLPSLETLRAIREDPSIQNKRIFLESFVSPTLRDKVKEIKDEDVDLFIDTLIRLQELQQELRREFRVEVPLRELWSGISEGFTRLYETLRGKYPEVKEEVRRQIDEGRRGWEEGRRRFRGKGLLPL